MADMKIAPLAGRDDRSHSAAKAAAQATETAIAEPESSRCYAEIGADHSRIVPHVGRRSVGDHLAFVQDHDAIASVEDHLEVVVDEDNAAAASVANAGDELDDLLRLRVIETRRRLVEEQELELAGDSPGDLQPTLQAVGQLLRKSIADVAGNPSPRSAAQRRSSGGRQSPSQAAATSTVSSAVNFADRRMFWKVRRMPSVAASRSVDRWPFVRRRARNCPRWAGGPRR